jgi:hypothetical protein
VEATGLQPVVDRVKALVTLQRLASGRGLTLRLLRPDGTASDAVHKPPLILTCEVTGLRGPYLVIFNITGNGTVQSLYPLSGDPKQVPVGQPYLISGLNVSQPFGSDHIVAVASPEPLTALQSEIAKLDKTQNAAAAIAAVEQAAARPNVQVGFQGIFTEA